jgi:hypothetical protein
MDWYFENIKEGAGDVADAPDVSDVNDFITANNAAGAETLLTVPTTGFVSNNDPIACGFSIAVYGAQQANDWEWRPDCGNGVDTNGDFITGNLPADTSIAADETFAAGWVTYLNAHFPGAAPNFYIVYPGI